MAGESARESARRQREKAERLQRSAELWERGAEGEQRTAEVLSELPLEWTVFHDLHWPGRKFANVDHVAVGPPGVFVIDSKNWLGKISVKGDVLRQNSYKRDREVASALDSASAVGQLLPRPELVTSVLCFVGDRQLSVNVQEVMVTSTDTLVATLLSRPAVLSPAELTRVRLALQGSLKPARGPQTRPKASPGPLPTDDSVQSRPRAHTRRTRKSTRPRGGSLVSSVVVLAALLTFLYVPAVRTAITDTVAGFITGTAVNQQPAPEKKKERGKHSDRRQTKSKK